MKHFLIVFNRKTGERHITEYADSLEAIRQRLDEERPTRTLTSKSW